MQVLNSRADGYVFANLFAVVVISITKHFMPPYINGVLIFSEFIIIPLVMGIISSWFWRDLNLSSRQLLMSGFYNTLLAIAFSAMFLGEGVICLIIVSPLIWVCISAGTFAGRYMFKRDNNNLNFSILSLLLFIYMMDVRSTHDYQNEVSDAMVINAPVSEVWSHVVAFKRINKENNFWLFKVGMPSPVQSTVDGYYLGAKRKCIFSNGYTFDEKISTFEINRKLTFDVTHQPRDPEIMGHIDILRGQFLLKDNGDNTTTLIGNSWYKLYVFPVWYYDIWAKSITRNVHLRVMEHIKELSEAK
ncbi:SRPBCC family protein [Mucilaginibacter ginkgonis]|uniref:Polyketide cyclase/dehydrase/lipid transport protein n=1 Tax=Mucilaginibacter ginkgonis TaxID=2682091 RepID=A0A6I4HYQ2_9SPHI|nr:hypothetical protein [Mucilaginibacter ginkgonis]QQL49591.1 hypothetical protein GO620_015670 [Mucilaginibacter ginkgonis]